MKKPTKSLPAEMMESVGNEPQISVAEASNAMSIDIDTIAPKQDPPESIESSLAFGAPVWANDKRVNGLYTTFHSHNAWMSIVGTGWVKLAIAKDSSCEAMTILASQARLKNSRMDYSVNGGTVDQMYIW